MEPDQENALRVICQRAGQNPESTWVDSTDIDPQMLARLVASNHIKQNVDGKVKLTPTGLVVARRPRRANASAQDGQP